MKHFDYVIAGAGIIGLTIAFELIKKKPDIKFQLLKNSVGEACIRKKQWCTAYRHLLSSRYFEIKIL